MKKRKQLGRKLLSFLLTLAMVVGVMPGMSLTAYAAESTVTWDQTVFDTHPVGGTIDGITFTFKSGMSAKYTFTAPEASTFTKIVFTANKNPSADSGQVSVENNDTPGDYFTKKATWTGNARSVVITVGSDGIGSVVFTLNTSDTIIYTVEDDGSVSVGNMSTEEWSKLVDDNGNLTIDLSEVSGSNSVEIAASAAESMMSALTVTDAGPGVMMWLKEDVSGMTRAWYGMDMPAPLLNEGAKLRINQLDLSDVSSSQGLSQAQAETLQGIKDALAIDISAAAPGIDFSELGDRKIGFYVNQPEEWDEAKTKGYYLREDGGTEEVPITFENKEIAAGTGRYAKMVLSHLSIYMLVQMADQGAPAKPTMASSTADSITLEAIANGEYRCDDGEWQTSPVFTGLSADTEYTFYQRLMGDAGHNASPSSEGAGFRVAQTHDGITFTAWTATNSMPTKAGNYYLANDVTISSTWNVPSGTTNLCLNGHGIIMSGTNRVITVSAGSTLNLYDCGTEAVHKFTVNNPSAKGAGLATVNDSLESGYQTFTGGYITGGNAGQGGGVYVDAGTFHMTGGTIIGNKATAGGYYDGGGVSLSNNASSRFVMTGGAIQHNTSTGRGPALGIANNATVELTGDARITHNSRDNNGWCGGIASYGTLNISGNVQITNNRGKTALHPEAGSVNISGAPVIFDNEVSDGDIHLDIMLNIVGELTEGAKLGVYWNNAKVFTDSSVTTYNDASKFVSDNPNYSVLKNADGQLYLGVGYTVTFDAGGHGTAPDAQTVATGSKLTKPTDPTAEGYAFDGWYKEEALTNEWDFESDTVTGNITLYAKWSNIVASVTTSDGVTTGYADLSAALNKWTEGSTLKLYADANLNSTITVNNTKTLDLNGFGMIRKYVSGDKGARNQGVFDVMGGNLTIIDSNADVVHRYKPATGGAGRATDIGKSDGTASFTGGYITGDVYGVSLGNQGTLNFKGGTIIGHERTGIWIEPGTLNMSDNAAIIANSCWGNGGGVELESGTFKMTDGTISYNMASNAGGGVFCSSQNTTLQLLGGSITGNVAQKFGGGVFSPGSTSTFEISGKVLITDNKKSDGTDNNVWLWDGAKISITGALSDGAQIGITMNTPGVFTSSSTVSNNDASKFSSDNNDYSVFKNADEQLCLGYTVTFDAGGHGTAPDAQTVATGSKLTKPTDPTAEGYAFDGWYKEEALTNEWDFESDTVTGNITLYAKWRQEISYIVTFKVVNGSWDDETTVDKTVTLTGYEGDTLKLAENQIPAVGSKPSATYKAGSWNVTPSTTTVISAATTYTYTYVQKASITPTVSMDGWTYGETAKTPSVNGNTGNGAVTYTYAKKNTTSFSKTVPSDAGEYTIKAVIAETDNYMAGEATTDFTIARANATVTAPTKNVLTYNGQDQILLSGGTSENGTMQYALGTDNQTAPIGDNAWSTGVPTGKNAGTYYVWYKVVGDDNHNDLVATTPVTAEIAKAAITIKADDKSTKYGADIAELTYVVSGAYVTGDDLGVTVSTTATNASPVNTYPISISWNNNANYTTTLTNGTYTITKADLTVSASGYSGTYDRQAHGISVDVGNSGATVYYGTAELTEQNYSNAGSTTKPTYTDVGTYTVYYYVTAANYDPQPVKGSQTVTIAKADTTVSAPSAATLTYDGSDRALVSGGSVTGGSFAYALGENDTTAPTGDHAWNAGVPTGKNAGTYYVWYKGVGDGNHNDSTPDCITVTIGKKAATISANAASKTYGDADPTLTANVAGTVGNDTLNYTLGRAAGENVNGYTITVTANAADNPNYDITTNNGTFTINKKALTITADSATKVYDTTALTKNSYTNTDLAAGDSIESVTIIGSQTTAASSANVPSSAVIKKGGTDVTTNYEITYVNGTLTVTQATTNTVTVDITGWTYGDSANAPTSEASFGANTVTYSYSNAQDGTYTATVPVNAGTWYVKASVAGTENYVAGEATKSFTIAKREVVISGIVAVDKNYDETTNAPLDFSKVSIANLVAADAGKLSVTATGTFEDEKVGKDKKVTITGLTLTGEKAGNYMLAANGQQTESKADISNMTTETGSGTDGNGDFIARVEDFNLNIKKVEGLDLELGKALCTPAELAMYEAGAKIELNLEIRVAEGLMTDDVVSKVIGILWNQEHVTMHGAKYFDITLYKKVGDADPVKVTDLGDKSITIKIGVPENMKNKNRDKTRTFFMVRMHDGEAAVLTRTTSEELTFNTSLFSTYAICYSDAPVWRPTQQTTSSNNTVTATVVAPKTSGTDETARTLLVFGTAFAVAAIVSRIYIFGRRKEEEE